jgi:tetratricopeptide (TPR) repeat protein
MSYKKFVGRSSELDKVRDWLGRSRGGLVLVTGSGGIGKTSLLQKISNEYSANDNFVVEYFDLAEQPIAIINQAVHLVNSIGVENFPEFDQKLRKLEAAKGEYIAEYDVVDTCIQEVAAYLDIYEKKLLRITDTFEIALKYKLDKDAFARGINEKLNVIQNTFFVIAGRDKLDDRDILGEILPILQEVFGDENILHIPLSGFDSNEKKEFFTVYDEHRKIPQTIREKLYMLTEGRPVLLLLAIDWLQKNIPLPEMIEKSLSELLELIKSEDSGKELLSKFEFELVSKVRELGTPLDIAVLYMAHIDRRIDSGLLSILLEIDSDKAEKELKKLISLPYVKEFIGSEVLRCTLHDEMSVLVNKHAWQYLDISGEERKRITRKIVDHYYHPSINELRQQKQDLLQLEGQTSLLDDVKARENNWERWKLEAETVYFYSKLNDEECFEYFDQAFYDKEESYIRDQFLLGELRRAKINKDKVALRDADDLRRRGHIEEARKICIKILEKERLDDVDLIHGYTTLGYMDFESDPIAAEKDFTKALELAISGEDIRLQAILHNNLGRLYRNISQLDESISNFEKALDLAFHSGDSLMIITTRNNLAWTRRVIGDLDSADTLCLLSIAESRREGHERPLAYAYLTKADIERDRGDLKNAKIYASEALELFRRLEDDEGKAQVYRTLANISRHSQNFEQALSYLGKGIDLVEDSTSYPLIASLYQLYGRTYRHYASYVLSKENIEARGAEANSLFKKAQSALQKSIVLAHDIGNRWEVARSQIENVLIMMLNEDAYDEAKINELLEQAYQTANELDNDLLRSYVYENRARIELRNERYFDAGIALGNAAWHIAKRTGQESTRAFSRLHNHLVMNPFLDKEQNESQVNGVLEQLQKQDFQEYPRLAALVNMCKQIIFKPNTEQELQ